MVSVTRSPIRLASMRRRASLSTTTYSRVPIPLSPASVTPAMIITADDAVTKRPNSSTPSARVMNGTDTAVSSIPRT